MANADFVCHVRISKGEIGDNIFGNQQPLKHRLVNKAAGFLEICPNWIEFRRFRTLTQISMNLIEIDRNRRSSGPDRFSLTERHRYEALEVEMIGCPWSSVTVVLRRV